MILHKNKKDFQNFIVKTSEILSIGNAFVEKDYWVTFALKSLFNSDMKNKIVFKGGTSLSKAYNLILRFSEDIDLTIVNSNTLNDNQKKNSLKKVHQCIQSPLKETKKTSHGSLKKVWYKYPTEEDYEYESISDTLLVEANSFGTFKPTEKKLIHTYIAEMLEKENHKELINCYELKPFEVTVLDFRKTFSEKIMALLRCSLGKDKNRLIKNIRHFYDITKLFNNSDVQKYIQGEGFIIDLKDIYKNDIKFNTFEKEWGGISKVMEVPLFDKLPLLESNFNNEFKKLLFSSEEIKFQQVEKTFKKLNEILHPLDLNS